MSECEQNGDTVTSVHPMVTRRLSYLLYDGTAVKIGSSQDIDGVFNRLRGCQTGNPKRISLIGVTDIEESVLHNRFADCRLCGEWFSLSHELLEFIASKDVDRVYKKIKGRWLREYV